MSLPKPHPWRDEYYRKCIYTSLVVGSILGLINLFLVGWVTAFTIMFIYLCAVPFSFKSIFGIGWNAYQRAQLEQLNDWIDSRTWNRVVVVDGEVQEGTPGNPSQQDPRQLP